MTDNEIIKTLECCQTGNCDECPFFGRKEDCEVELPEEALDLINRQKAEIERLQKANGLLKYLKEAVCRVEIGGKEEVVEYASDEAFYNAITKKINLMCNVQTAKSEAIKEFAERLKERALKNPFHAGIVDLCEINNLLTELTERKEDEGK